MRVLGAFGAIVFCSWLLDACHKKLNLKTASPQPSGTKRIAMRITALPN
jgi:hypothetical protein